MLCADDIIILLCITRREEVEKKPEERRRSMEDRYLKISRTKLRKWNFHCVHTSILGSMLADDGDFSQSCYVFSFICYGEM